MNDTIAYVKKYASSQTGKLAITYLAIIMAMTIVFSVVIYLIATSQLEPSIAPQFEWLDFLPRQQLEEIFRARVSQARTNLILSLVFLNIVSLVCGAVLSHFLARRTLEPIESAMEAQKQFVSDASHELRTPLTALQTTNEVALRKKKFSIDDARELMRYNVLEVIKLHELTNSLLGLVKQESAATTRQQFSVQSVTRDVIEKFALVISERKITVATTNSSIMITANQAAVDQVLTILLDNAIKYSPDGSKIRFSVEEAGDEVRISIIDQGIGIGKDQQAKIFEIGFIGSTSHVLAKT